MPEAKPFASLTSSLLARKGAAQPAMRRTMSVPGFAGAAAIAQDDLGWNDMGGDMLPATAPTGNPSPAASLTPMTCQVFKEVSVPPVIAERRKLAERVAEAHRARNIPANPARKAAFTLRLDVDRHLRLRCASAMEGRSAQQIVTEALDKYLGDVPELDRLTHQPPPMRGRKQGWE